MDTHLALNANGKRWIGIACAAIFGYGASASFEKLPRESAPDKSAPATAAHQLPDGKSPETTFDAVEMILSDPDPANRNLRLWRLWEEITPSDIPAALSLLQRSNDGSIVYLKLKLLEHWATFDPTGALAWARGLSEAELHPAYDSIITIWATNDPAAALEWARALPRRERGSKILWIARAIAAKNPDEALRLLGNDPDLKAMSANRSVRAVFESIASVDPRKAIEAALLFPEGTSRKEALKSIASVWTASDPRSALSWIKELPAGPLRNEAMQSAIDHLSWQEPETAAKLALAEISPGDDQTLRVSWALTSWVARDVAAARAWLEQLPPGTLRQSATYTLVNRWANQDPRAAMTYALDAPTSANRGGLIGSVFSEWLTIDPESGVGWMTANPSLLTPDILSQTVDSLSYQTPEHAVRLIPFLPEGKTRDSAYGTIARSWASNDVRVAEQWMKTLPEGSAKERFFQGFIESLAESNVAAAAEKIEALPEGPLKESSLSSVAATWAKVDAPAALEWVGTAQPSAAQEKTVAEIIRTWARSDIDSASDWLNTLAPGSLRDKAIASFSSTITGNDPQSAAIWAASISNEESRKSTLSAVIGSWLKSDERAAQAWIQFASIPAEWKNEWFKK